jgi:exopolysaccharide biosynthesis polyprenyl glycosylphosphotransferase
VAGLLAADGLAAALAVTLALVLTPAPGARWPQPVLVLLVAVPFALHTWRGLYRPRLSPSALGELPALCGLALLQWYGTAEALTAYDPRYAADWTVLARAVAVQALLACAGRAAVHHSRRSRAVRRPQSALVVGRGPVAQKVTAALYDHAEYGLRPVGRVGGEEPGDAGDARDAGDAGDVVPQSYGVPLPVLVTPEDVSRAVIQNCVRHAVLTQPPGPGPQAAALVALFAAHGCRVWLVDSGAAKGSDHLWGFAVRPLRGTADRPFARAVKRAMDTLFAVVALLGAAPVMGFCALAVRLCDGPGVIFRQERVGLDGQPFVLLKFRTISPADEHESATRWSVALDRRLSATGRLLRRTSLDELPQLWNVLRGDMSLVGPRPERPYFVAKFSRAYPGYSARHRMPVGITGLAQVNGLRGDTSIEDRARFDNHYIDTWSLWQDVCILARTAGCLFRFSGS